MDESQEQTNLDSTPESTTKTSTKKKSWAPTVTEGEAQEQMDTAKFMATRQAMVDKAILTIAESLKGIFKELKRGNDWVMEGEPLPVATAAEDDEEPEFPVPTNLENDAEIESYYRDVLGKFLDDSTLAKVGITVEEDRVIVKLPYLRDGNLFGRIAGQVRDLGGEYLSAGKDSHFILPKP